MQRPRLFYGWIIVLVAAFGTFFSGPGQTFGVSAFVDPMIAHFGWSRSLVSSLYSAGTLGAGLLVGFVGYLVDRLGHRITMTAVAALFGLATLWMSFVSTPAMLLAGFLLIRLLGQGSMTLTATTLVPQWFIRLRGRAMSLVGLGFAVSSATVPPLNTWMIQTFGLGPAWRLWSLLLVGVMAPMAWLLVRGRPEEMDLLPDGAPAPEASGDGAGGGAAGAGVPGEPDWTLKEALATRAFWVLLLCSMVPAMINTGMIFHHVSILGDRGLSAEVAAGVFSVAAAVNLPLTFLAGWVLDRVPVRYVFAGTMVGQLALILWALNTTSPAMALGYGVLRGAVQAFESLIGSVLWANYFGRRALGSIRGITMTSMVVGTALGPLPFGIARDLLGSYDQILLLMMIFPLLGALGALMSPPPQKASR